MDSATELSSTVNNVFVGISVFIGVIQCFWGYRIFKIILALTGFVVGGIVAATVALAVTGESGVAIIAGILGGLAGAGLFYALYFIGVFILGGLLGAILGIVVFLVIDVSPEPIVLAVLAVIGGILAIIIQKLVIILATAYSGSWSIVTGVAHFLDEGGMSIADLMDDPQAAIEAEMSNMVIMIVCWFLVGTIGVLTQYDVFQKLFAKGPDTGGHRSLASPEGIDGVVCPQCKCRVSGEWESCPSCGQVLNMAE